MKYYIKITLVLVAISIGFPLILKAQFHKEFIKATILLQNNEKNEGFIRNDDLKAINYAVYFKSSLEEEILTKYDTSSVSRIIVDSAESYQLLSYKPHYSKGTIRVIAWLVVKGNASLYKAYYKESVVFILNKDGINYPLQEDELLGDNAKTTRYFYKEYLKKAVFDYDELIDMVNNSSYSQESIIRVVNAYNKLVSPDSKTPSVENYKEKTKKYVFVDVGGMIKNSSKSEFCIQGVYRLYFPMQSKTSSLNFGLSIYQLYHTESSNYSNYFPINVRSANFKRTLISLPITVQQNILNKKNRPFVAFGASLSYLNEVNDVFEDHSNNGLQKNFGVSFNFALGVETDLQKNIRAKVEYRDEAYSHLLMLGLGYYF